MKPLLCIAVLVLTSAKICDADEKKAAEAREYQKHNKREILYPDALGTYPANQNYGGEFEKSNVGYSPIFNHADGQHVINLLNVGTGKDLLNQDNHPVLLQQENGEDYNEGSFGYGEEEHQGIVFGNGNQGLGQGHEGIFLGNGNKEQEGIFLGNNDNNKGLGQYGNNDGIFGHYGNSEGVFENEAVNLNHFDEANDAILGSNLNLQSHDEILQLEKGNTDFLNFGSVKGGILNFANSGSNTDAIANNGIKGNLKHKFNLGTTGNTNIGNLNSGIVSLNNAGIKGASVVSLNNGGGKQKYTVINLEHIGKQKDEALVTEKPKNTYGGTINLVNDLKQKPVATIVSTKQTVLPAHKPDTIPVIKFSEMPKPSVEPTSLNYGEEIKDNPDSTQKRIRIPVKLIPLPGKPQQFKIEHISPEDLPLIKKQQEQAGTDSDEQHIAIIKHIPVAFAKYVDKPYQLKIYVEKPVIRQKIIKVPYKVEIPKPYTVVKKIPFPVKVYEQVPKPYPVYKDIPVPVTVYVDKHVPKYVDKPIPVKVGKDGRVLEESSSEKEKIKYDDFKHVKPLTLKEFQALEAKSLSETQLHSSGTEHKPSEQSFSFAKTSVASNMFGNNKWEPMHGFGNSASASENKHEYMDKVQKPESSENQYENNNAGDLDANTNSNIEQSELDVQATSLHQTSSFKGSTQLPDSKTNFGNDFSQHSEDPFARFMQSRGSEFIPYATPALEHTNSYENAPQGDQVGHQLDSYENQDYVTGQTQKDQQLNGYENGYPEAYKQSQNQQSASESTHSHVSVSPLEHGNVHPNFEQIIEQESAQNPQFPKYKRSGVSWSPVLEQFQPSDAVTRNAGFVTGNKRRENQSESGRSRSGRQDSDQLKSEQLDGRDKLSLKFGESTDFGQKLQSEQLNTDKDWTTDQYVQSFSTKSGKSSSKKSAISKDTHVALQHGFLPFKPLANKRSSDNHDQKAAASTNIHDLNTKASTFTKKTTININSEINAYKNAETKTLKQGSLNRFQESNTEYLDFLQDMFTDNHKNEAIKSFQGVNSKPIVHAQRNVKTHTDGPRAEALVAPEVNNESGFKPMKSGFVPMGLNLQQHPKAQKDAESAESSKMVHTSSAQAPNTNGETKTHIELTPKADGEVNQESRFKPIKSGFKPMGLRLQQDAEVPSAEELVASRIVYKSMFPHTQIRASSQAAKTKGESHNETPRAEAFVAPDINNESRFRPLKSGFAPMGLNLDRHAEVPTVEASDNIYKSVFEHMQSEEATRATKAEVLIGNESGLSSLESNSKHRSSGRGPRVEGNVSSESGYPPMTTKGHKQKSFKASKADPTVIQAAN